MQYPVRSVGSVDEQADGLVEGKRERKDRLGEYNDVTVRARQWVLERDFDNV